MVAEQAPFVVEVVGREKMACVLYQLKGPAITIMWRPRAYYCLECGILDEDDKDGPDFGLSIFVSRFRASVSTRPTLEFRLH